MNNGNSKNPNADSIETSQAALKVTKNNTNDQFLEQAQSSGNLDLNSDQHSSLAPPTSSNDSFEKLQTTPKVIANNTTDQLLQLKLLPSRTNMEILKNSSEIQSSDNFDLNVDQHSTLAPSNNDNNLPEKSPALPNVTDNITSDELLLSKSSSSYSNTGQLELSPKASSINKQNKVSSKDSTPQSSIDLTKVIIETSIPRGRPRRIKRPPLGSEYLYSSFKKTKISNDDNLRQLLKYIAPSALIESIVSKDQIITIDDIKANIEILSDAVPGGFKKVENIKNYFSDEAYKALVEKIENKNLNDISWSCNVCFKTLHDSKGSIECNDCWFRYHFSCVRIRRKPNKNTKWSCPRCRKE